MHMSSAFPGWGTPGIPGGIATFYIKVTQFSAPSGMIWKQSLHPGEIRKAMRQWETMAATHWRLKMSPILGQEKGPEDQKDPGTGAHSSSILADSPGSPGVPLPGKADDKCIMERGLWGTYPRKKKYHSPVSLSFASFKSKAWYLLFPGFFISVTLAWGQNCKWISGVTVNIEQARRQLN